MATTRANHGCGHGVRGRGGCTPKFDEQTKSPMVGNKGNQLTDPTIDQVVD